MEKKKNQHFIPRLYLKFFSTHSDNLNIGLYQLTNGFFKAKVPLKPQAKEHYFYGEDGVLEEQLSKLENLAARHLRQTIEDCKLPPKYTEAFYHIFEFTMILASRTKDSAERVKELTNKLMQEVVRNDHRFKSYADKYEVHPKNPAAMAIAAAAERLRFAFDLKPKLLLNKTPVKFITSDNPVAKYNQFLEQRRHPGGHLGMFSKGLQVFLPLSPNLMLHLYDDWAYKVGGRMHQTVEINDPSDINKLNALQVLNSFEMLFFNEHVSEKYIQDLFHEYKDNRQEEYSRMRRVHSYFDTEDNEHIYYHSYSNNLEIGLELTFINQTKKAKHHILSDYVVQLRKEELRGKFGNGN